MQELRARASRLVKAGQLEPAAEALAELVGSFPDDVSLLASYSNVLLKLERWPAAAATAARVDALSPRNAATATRALRLLLRAADLTGAVEVAERCRDLWSEDPTLALLSARALAENGEALQALELLRSTLRLAPELPKVWHEAIKAAQAVNDQTGAFDLALEGAQRHPEDSRLQKQALRLALTVDDERADLLVLARSAARLAPDDPYVHRLAGHAYGRTGRWSEAINHYQKAAELAPSSLSALSVLFNASERAKDFERAADTAAQMTELQADDPRSWRKLAEANWRAGREAASRAAFDHSVALRDPDMPDDLASGLRAFRRKPGSLRMPDARLDWAYSVHVATHKGTPTDRETWDRAAHWGCNAHRLLLDWQEVRPERHDELARLVDLRGLELLETSVRHGKGAFLAIGHLGPVLAISAVLYRYGLPFRWLSDIPGFPGGPLYERLISVKYARSRAALAGVHAALTSGQIVVAAMDLDRRREPQTDFFGQKICVNQTAARMVHWVGAAPLFLDGRWDGNRIVFNILPMVAPQNGESADAYLVRWKADYLHKLADIMSSAPENLYCPGGLWTGIGSQGVQRNEEVASDGPSVGD
jgi:tetratricopeptide (TPR) repeat protein